jgi:2-dehydro-3-deoxygluconokinase
MRSGLDIRPSAALDFLSLGALVHRLDPGAVPFRKATACAIHVSGGEFNTAANLADCFRMKTAVATAMVDYPIGDLIQERVRAMGVRPFYKHFQHDGARGPNMAAVYSDRGQGVRAPVVFYNRSNEAAAQLKPGDFDWAAIFRDGVRWFHSGGIFAALSETTAELIIEGMQAAKAAGAIVSFDLNYREKLWNLTAGGHDRALSVLGRIVRNVDVLVGNEEDLQKGLGIPGPEVEARPQRLLGHDRSRGVDVPADQGGGHHHARGALHEPPRVERGRLDRWNNARGADLRAGRVRPRGRRRRFRVRHDLRASRRRGSGRGGEDRLGPRRAAHHDSR